MDGREMYERTGPQTCGVLVSLLAREADGNAGDFGQALHSRCRGFKKLLRLLRRRPRPGDRGGDQGAESCLLYPRRCTPVHRCAGYWEQPERGAIPQLCAGRLDWMDHTVAQCLLTSQTHMLKSQPPKMVLVGGALGGALAGRVEGSMYKRGSRDTP